MPSGSQLSKVKTIGIDARLYSGNYTGIGTYTRSLVDNMAGLDRRNKYVLYTDHHFKRPGNNFAVINIPFPNRTIWTQLLLPAKARSHHLDLFHATANHELPLLLQCPFVVTVHDLIPVLFPKTVTPRHRMIFRSFIKPAVKRSKAVITDSEFVRKDLISRFGLTERQVFTIPLAYDPSFTADLPDDSVDRIKRKHGLRGRYILYVGALEPRKNIPSLVSAFKKALSLPGLEDWQLVLAGGSGWYKEQILNAAASSGLVDRLVMTGFIIPEELPALYRGADLFVYPSIYEGFGLPVLEAMASGTAVLVSSPSALEELAGPAGTTFRLDDPDDLNKKLVLLMEDGGLRRSMAEAGIERASLYSWDRCARETHAVYENILFNKMGTH